MLCLWECEKKTALSIKHCLSFPLLFCTEMLLELNFQEGEPGQWCTICYENEVQFTELGNEELLIWLPPKSTAEFLNREFQVKSFQTSVFQFLIFQRRKSFPRGKKQNNIIFQLALCVTNVCFCKVLLDHQMKVTGEVENIIKKIHCLNFPQV